MDTKQDDIAISVQHVSKYFHLPHERSNTLKTAALNLVRGKSPLKRSYELQHALQDVSFEVKRGEFFGIVGRNGSGKSTLLKMLAGIYQPTKGNVRVEGKLVPFIELGVGFNGELTGRENVYLNGALLGFSRKEMEQRYDEIVAFAELEKFMDQKLKNYSSGMQVRLAFSLAVQTEADILLVDEVLAVGDADFQRKCFEYFRELKRTHKTVVFVSHDMNSVREYCDRAILIEKNEIIAAGSPDKIATKYTKMFFKQTQDENRKHRKGSERWGDGAIKFTKVTTDVTDEHITIRCTAKVHEAIDYPVFGFAVKNSAGQPILGTNSAIRRVKIDHADKGQEIHLTWKFPNILNDGDYSVEPTAIRQNTDPCDWWEDAHVFSINKEEKTPYIANPQVELQVVKE
jgi:ABC-2 type transport system ATP-binding protein